MLMICFLNAKGKWWWLFDGSFSSNHLLVVVWTGLLPALLIQGDAFSSSSSFG